MKSAIVGLGVSVLMLVGCDSKPATVLRDSMKDVVAPQAQVVWDVGNKALDDEGKPDASQMTDADWAQIQEAGQRLRDLAVTLSEAKHVTVAGYGEKLENEGNTGAFNATQVQGFIDSDMPIFTTMAAALAANADQIVAASTARDAGRLVDASGALVEICEACHVKFWYPPDGSEKQ